MGSGNWDPKYGNEYTNIIRIKNVKIVDYKKIKGTTLEGDL